MQNTEEIYEKYFKTVYKYLFCLTHNPELSEELTQETFYRAIQKIDTFKKECKMSVWLCQIAKNIWYNESKKNKRIENIPDEQLVFIPDKNQVEDIAILNDDKIKLYKQIQKLDEATRNVIYLRITGELSFKEIGDILNKTETWARVTFYRGRQKLKGGDRYEREEGL